MRSARRSRKKVAKKAATGAPSAPNRKKNRIGASHSKAIPTAGDRAKFNREIAQAAKHAAAEAGFELAGIAPVRREDLPEAGDLHEHIAEEDASDGSG